jgi:hypothetical protein
MNTKLLAPKKRKKAKALLAVAPHVKTTCALEKAAVFENEKEKEKEKEKEEEKEERQNKEIRT